jgi:hypothetical protein
MFRIHNLLHRERNGYYTYDQIVEAIGYLQADREDQKVILDHLHTIISKMAKYKMEIVLAREVLDFDEICDAVVGTYKIHPMPFKSISDIYTDHIVSAPEFRDAECCGNCAFFDNTTEQDCMESGICSLHTETDPRYDPPLKEPLELDPKSICKDFTQGDD